MNNYEINEETLAIIPMENKTIIHEVEKYLEINEPTEEIIKNSCEYFGSSLEGRQKGTTYMTGITHKVPIIVEESREMIFFPTSSPRISSCGWISFNNIKTYHKSNNGTIIEFKNGKKIFLNLSYGVVDNQILRSTKLNLILRDRKTKK